MTNDTKTKLAFEVWYSGSNMPGYCCDEPAHPCESWEAARNSVVDDIDRDIDDSGEDDATDLEERLAIAELNAERIELKTKLLAMTEPGDSGFTVGNRHYFVSEGTATTEGLESADCEPSDYSPILGEWITREELEALESLNYDVTIVEAQTRYNDEQAWKTVKLYDDTFGEWFIGKQSCGWSVFANLIIRAKSWESAYEIYVDESRTVPTEELHEAYDMTAAEFAAKCAEIQSASDARECIDYPELAAGYSHQSSSTNTGIVDTSDFRMDAAGDEHNQVRFKVIVEA